MKPYFFNPFPQQKSSASLPGNYSHFMSFLQLDAQSLNISSGKWFSEHQKHLDLLGVGIVQINQCGTPSPEFLLILLVGGA